MKAGTQARQRLGVRWQNPKGVLTPLSTAGGVIERPQALESGVTAAALQDAPRFMSLSPQVSSKTPTACCGDRLGEGRTSLQIDDSVPPPQPSPRNVLYLASTCTARERGPSRFIRSLFLLLVSSFSLTSLHAHHGRDFILIQDSAIPDYLSGVAIAGYEWTRDGDTNEFSTEPGFFIGLAPALAFGMSAGFSDEGDGWRYTGITPQFVLSILPPTGPMNFRAGLWTGYEFAEASDHADSGSDGHVHNPGSGPDAGPPTVHDHSGGHDHGSHGGIHRHGESGWYNRIILEADVTEHTRIIFNLITFVSGTGGKPGFGYAAGIRHEFSHDLSLGIETIGDFEERQSSHQVLFTTMIGLPKHFSLRLGVGAGLTPSSPDFTMHSSVLWRF